MFCGMSCLHVLITAGPTREPIDPVRFISNRSSGKMGYALAEAAITAGHRVTLVSGPSSLKPPLPSRWCCVETAVEMRAKVLKEAKRADVIIMAAAVADYQPVRVAHTKMKKERERMILQLKRTPDILAELGRRKTAEQLLIGFAAETDHLLARAKQKLESKNLDLILANHIGRKGEGFESNNNQITILYRDGRVQHLLRMSKKRLARRLIALILQKSRGKSW